MALLFLLDKSTLNLMRFPSAFQMFQQNNVIVAGKEKRLAITAPTMHRSSTLILLLGHFIFLAGFVCTIWLIFNTVSNWIERPFSNQIEQVPITNIDFPAITICPLDGTE